jgi:hypothetical protein
MRKGSGERTATLARACAAAVRTSQGLASMTRCRWLISSASSGLWATAEAASASWELRGQVEQAGR